MIGNFWTTYFWAHKEEPPGSGNVVFCSGCNTETGCGPCNPTCFACSGCPCLDGPEVGQEIMFQAHIYPTFSNEVTQNTWYTCPTGIPYTTCNVIPSQFCCMESLGDEDFYYDDCSGPGLSQTYDTGNVAFRGIETRCPLQPPFPCQQDPDPHPCGSSSNIYSCCDPGCTYCSGGNTPACFKPDCPNCYACSGGKCSFAQYQHTLVGSTFVSSSLFRVTGPITQTENGTPCGFATEQLVGNDFHGIADGVPCGNANGGLKSFGYIGMADENGEFFWNGMKFSGIPSTDANPNDQQYNCPGTLFVGASSECGCGPVKRNGCRSKTTCGYDGYEATGFSIGGCKTEISALYAGDVSGPGDGVTYSQVGRWCRTSRVAGPEYYRSGGEIVSDLPTGGVPGPNRGVISPSSFTIRCGS